MVGEPEISDFEYDQLFAELKDLEEKFPELRSPTSPTLRVGGTPLEGLEQVAHAVPMLSLDNSYSLEELRAWHDRVCRDLGGEPAGLEEDLVRQVLVVDPRGEDRLADVHAVVDHVDHHLQYRRDDTAASRAARREPCLAP